MNKTFAVLAGILALSISGAAFAQTPSESKVDPVKMQLARQLMDLNGGQKQYDARMKSVFDAMKSGMAPAFTPDQNKIQNAMYGDMEQELLGLAPKMLELSARAYANDLTEKELRDLIAFRQSESGQSIQAKMPQVQQEIISETMPLVVSMLPSIMKKVSAHVCEENHCSVDERKAMDEAMAKVMTHPAS